MAMETLEQVGRRVKSVYVEILRGPKIFLRVWATSSSTVLTQPLWHSIVRNVFYIEMVDKVEMVDKMKSGGKV
jgi:hypothetical protein